MLSQARLEALVALTRRHRWRLVVLFGSSVHGARRDVDLAVLPAQLPDGIQPGNWPVISLAKPLGS